MSYPDPFNRRWAWRRGGNRSSLITLCRTDCAEAARREGAGMMQQHPPGDPVTYRHLMEGLEPDQVRQVHAILEDRIIWTDQIDPTTDVILTNSPPAEHTERDLHLQGVDDADPIRMGM